MSVPPQKVYYVMAENVKGLRYGQRGGGMFTQLHHAVARITRIKNHVYNTRLFEGEVTWKEITDEG